MSETPQIILDSFIEGTYERLTTVEAAVPFALLPQLLLNDLTVTFEELSPALLVQRVKTKPLKLGPLPPDNWEHPWQLLPWLGVRVLMSSGNWKAFYTPIKGPLKDLQYSIRELVENHLPDRVKPGEWHLPFLSFEQKRDLSVEECLQLSKEACSSFSQASAADHVALALGFEHPGRYLGWQTLGFFEREGSVPYQKGALNA